MNHISRIIINHIPLNKWMHKMCVKQPRTSDGGCIVGDEYMDKCNECRFKNLYNLSGVWD